MDEYTIISLNRDGKSNREVAKITGADRKTVARYWSEYQNSLNKLDQTDTTDEELKKFRKILFRDFEIILQSVIHANIHLKLMHF